MMISIKSTFAHNFHRVRLFKYISTPVLTHVKRFSSTDIGRKDNLDNHPIPKIDYKHVPEDLMYDTKKERTDDIRPRFKKPFDRIYDYNDIVAYIEWSYEVTGRTMKDHVDKFEELSKLVSEYALARHSRQYKKLYMIRNRNGRYHEEPVSNLKNVGLRLPETSKLAKYEGRNLFWDEKYGYFANLVTKRVKKEIKTLEENKKKLDGINDRMQLVELNHNINKMKKNYFGTMRHGRPIGGLLLNEIRAATLDAFRALPLAERRNYEKEAKKHQEYLYDFYGLDKFHML